MDWNQAGDEERTTLTRIASLLLALADLAELTVTRSPAIRALVLWLLLPAEAVARNLVTAAPAPCPFRHAGISRADAMRLARRFRNLAREVDRHATSAVEDDIGQDEPAWESLYGTLRGAVAASLIGRLASPATAPIALGVVGAPDTS